MLEVYRLSNLNDVIFINIAMALDHLDKLIDIVVILKSGL